MYCPVDGHDCISSIKCQYCPSLSKNIWDNSQFNYECPNCRGKFNNPTIPAVYSSLYYKCPFCGMLMEGLK